MKFKNIFFFVLIFCMFDLFFTIIGIELGVLEEANPIGKFTLELGYFWAFIIQIIYSIAVSLLIWYLSARFTKKEKNKKVKNLLHKAGILAFCIPRIIAVSMALYYILKFV